MQSQFERVADCLPEVVLEMVELVDFSEVEKIIHQFGGTNFLFSDDKVYFPKLKALIGLESAVKLLRYLKSERLYIPRCEVALRLLRNERLKADFDFLTQMKKKAGVGQCWSFAKNTNFPITMRGILSARSSQRVLSTSTSRTFLSAGMWNSFLHSGQSFYYTIPSI
ncbi:hypothetical protein BKG96_05120 [Rodentibacter caecimuris]|uniref:Mor transcription activator domain-containing protein n=1 Tax=Rodentibacter caecimuris TaxID=1796644 RepID=A0A1V3KM45_9PAST|nr:hypothetical protein BKG96_05120 [Rodentibacter heylii]